MNHVSSILYGFCLTAVLVSPSVGQVESWQPTEHASADGSGTCNTCNVDGYAATAYCERPAKIQYTLDLLIMSRDGVNDVPLLRDLATGEVLLQTGSLSSGTEPGVRTGVIFFDDPGGIDLEFSYLGLDEFKNSETRSSQNGVTFAFFDGIPANPQNQYTVSYKSELNSGEINLRHRRGERFTLIGGFRFLELNERFNISSGQGVFASNADNDLYGFQLGADLNLVSIRRSLVFATIKSGIYYNNSDISARAAAPGGGPVQFIDDEDVAAYVGDVAIGLLVPMGPQADLRIGYQGLYLDGVALGPDQSDDFSLFTSSGTADTSTLLYHGGFIGFDLFW